MPRRKRNYITGLPYHLVQRGNNRQACFHDSEDYELYLKLWRKKSRWYGVDVHAFCLMTNHIHFVVTARCTDAISNTMKVVGSCYAQAFNRRYRRSGTLWEGRHRSSLVDSERYLLTCCRYVELNPVRAGMCESPSDYPWSSYKLNASPDQGWLSEHDVYLALGSNGGSRAYAYRKLFGARLADIDIAQIRKAAHYNQPLGDEAFVEKISAQFGIPVGYCQRGRPRKSLKETAG